MGCHTWFYKKVELSVEEARKRFVENNKRLIELNKSIIDDKNFEDVDWVEFDEDTGHDDDYRRWVIKLMERQIRMVEAGRCDRAIYNHQPELSIYIDYKGFFVNTNYHDLFRTSGYPNDVLWSLEETLEYITKNKCSTYEWTEKMLKEFWNEHPDGLIKFG